jgi:hypothetical protein
MNYLNFKGENMMFKDVFVLKIEEQKLLKVEVEKFFLIQKNWKEWE